MYDAFGRADALHREVAEDAGKVHHEADEQDDPDDDIQYQNLLRESTTLVYDGCQENRIHAPTACLVLRKS